MKKELQCSLFYQLAEWYSYHKSYMETNKYIEKKKKILKMEKKIILAILPSTLDKNLHSGKTTQYSQMQITKHQEGSNSQILNKIHSMKC